MHAVIAWILSFMLANINVEVSRKNYHSEETVEEFNDRLKTIAEDFASVTFDPNEKSIFSGDSGRLETAAMLASIATYESRFRKDVDMSTGPHARGDHGNSVCIMQIYIPAGRHTVDGYTRDEVMHDRKKCIRAGLHLAAYSFHACESLPLEGRLRLYASGTCARGSVESRDRVMTGVRWFDAHRPTITDAQVLTETALDQAISQWARD